MPAIRAAAAAPGPPRRECPSAPGTPRPRTRRRSSWPPGRAWWRSVYQPAMLHEMPHLMPNSFAPACGSIAPISTTISTGSRRCLPSSVSSYWRIVRPFSDSSRAPSVISETLPRTKRHPFFEQALIDLFVILHGGAQVDVERVDLGLGLFEERGGRTSKRPCSRPTNNRGSCPRRGCRRNGRWRSASARRSSRMTILPLVGPAALQSHSNSRFV